MSGELKSLRELGYTVEPIKGKDSKGNDWVFRVKGPAPTFFIKRTRNGNLRAYKTKDQPLDTTISGLYNFKAQESEHEGTPVIDLMGSPLTTATSENKPAQPISQRPSKVA